MNTSKVPDSLLSAKLEASKLASGEDRLLGQAAEYNVEIIPNKSVAFFLAGISKEVLSVITLFIGSTEEALTLLTQAAFFVAKNPNETFNAQLPNGLLLTLTKIAASDGQTLHLSISDTRPLPRSST